MADAGILTPAAGATAGIPTPPPKKAIARPTPASQAPAHAAPSDPLGLGDTDAQLAADRARVESLRPETPVLQPSPKPPPPTDPFQAFGQPAMWLGLVGSLLTRRPLTTAIMAAGGVINSVKQQNAALAQQQFNEWKVSSDNALKLVKYEQDAYNEALKTYSTDARAGESRIRTLAFAFKNAGLIHAINTGGMDAGVRYIQNLGQNGSTLSIKAANLKEKLQEQVDQLEARQAWDAANPNATPEQRAQAHLAIDKGQPPEKPETTAWAIYTDPATQKQFRARTGSDGKPEYQDLAGNPIGPPSGMAKPQAPGQVNAEADKTSERTAWDQANPNATPQEKSAAHLIIDKGGDPDAAKGATANWSQPVIDPKTNVQYIYRVDKDGNIIAKTMDGHSYKPSGMAKPSAPGSANAEKESVFADYKTAHPGVSDGDAWKAVERDMAMAKTGATADSIHQTAELIASYQEAPLSTFAMSRGLGSEIMSEVRKLNPDYQASRFSEVNRAMVAFGSGAQGNTVRFLNVATQHLEVMSEAADALRNGNVRLTNDARNRFAAAIGEPAPTTFDGLKHIVGTEIQKAIAGGIGAVADRDRLMEALDSANSPAQLDSVIASFKHLMAGQAMGLKQQYEDATSFTTGPFSFDRKLLPATRRELGLARGGASHPDSLPDGSVVTQGGVKYRKRGNDWVPVE